MSVKGISIKDIYAIDNMELERLKAEDPRKLRQIVSKMRGLAYDRVRYLEDKNIVTPAVGRFKNSAAYKPLNRNATDGEVIAKFKGLKDFLFNPESKASGARQTVKDVRDWTGLAREAVDDRQFNVIMKAVGKVQQEHGDILYANNISSEQLIQDIKDIVAPGYDMSTLLDKVTDLLNNSESSSLSTRLELSVDQFDENDVDSVARLISDYYSLGVEEGLYEAHRRKPTT